MSKYVDEKPPKKLPSDELRMLHGSMGKILAERWAFENIHASGTFTVYPDFHSEIH
jgi:hypothetical protein